MGKVFAAITVGFLIVSGINPHDRFTWLLEVSWVIAGLGVLGYLRYKGILLSGPLKIALFVHLHLIYGGWYTYELTPLGMRTARRSGLSEIIMTGWGISHRGCFRRCCIGKFWCGSRRLRAKHGGSCLCLHWRWRFRPCLKSLSFYPFWPSGRRRMHISVHRAISGMRSGIWSIAGWVLSFVSYLSLNGTAGGLKK